MSGSIFVVDDKNRILELKESKFQSEDIFQELIERYPNILAGDQITPENPRKWIFISREIGVPDKADEILLSLKRIIEFLNSQMMETEVLGLEIKQFISDKNLATEPLSASGLPPGLQFLTVCVKNLLHIEQLGRAGEVKDKLYNKRIWII